MRSSRELLIRASQLLAQLKWRVVFVGGATVHLHIDDPAAPPVRTTKDVDIVVAVVNYAEYSEVEQQLRDIGFEQSLSEDGPICRWERDGLLLDVIPTKPDLVGFSESRWFERGYESAVQRELDGTTIDVFDVLHLLAAKIEAFDDRGDGDLFASQDFEDIAVILDGSQGIWELLSEENEVASFIRGWLSALDPLDAEDAISGHTGSHERARMVMDHLRNLIE